MVGPVEIVHSLHAAFRRDISQIDDAAFKIARGGGDFAPVLDRFHVLGEVLDYHARGEEAAVFPAVDNLMPQVARAYLMDHRELDVMVGGLEELRKAPTPLETARATAALNSFLRIHLDKEDVHLYPILWARTSESEQAAIGRQMSQKVPPEKFPVLIGWLFPLLELDEQVAVARGWMGLMPPQVFSNVKPLIEKAVGGNWAEVNRRISKPEQTQVQ